MDDDVDIYGDLPHFDVNECSECKEKIKELTEAKSNWEEEKNREDSAWKLKYEKERDEKEMVLKNSSSLMKTARAEIDRKDRIIMDLRRELEDFKFRRKGYNRSQKRYAEPKESKIRQEITKDNTEVPIGRIKTLAPLDQPELTNFSENEEEDCEQQWEADQDTLTVYGERLRRKIALEDEAERVQKEEAKIALSNPESICAKVEPAENQVIENLNNIVKLEFVSEETFENLNAEELPIAKFETAISESGSLHSSENEEKCLRDRKNVYENFHENIIQYCEPVEYEKNHRDDFRYNPHFNPEASYNIHESRNKFDRVSRHNGNDRSSYDKHENSRYPRDRSRNSDYERKSRKLEENPQDRTRLAYKKRSRSNYRARSRSYDRKRDEKKLDRQRGDNFRNLGDRYEKQRSNGLTRDRYNYFERNNRDFPDLRERFEDKIGGRNDNDKHKNKKVDSNRIRKSYSPCTKSRSSSRGRVRGREIDKRKSRRSRCREGNADAEINTELNRERDKKKRGSRDRKIPNERNDGNFKSSGRNSTKNLTNDKLPDEPKNYEKLGKISATEMTSNDLLHDETKNLETTRRNSAKDSMESEFLHESKNIEKSRRNSVKDITSNELPSEMTNLEKLLRNSAEDPTNSDSSSREPEVSDNPRKMFEVHQTKIEEPNVNGVAVTGRMENLLSPSEAKEKFIFMLENDSGSPLIPLTRQDVVPIGSRSFREEKIENIEKFIQDFQYNENHCVLLGNDISEEPNGEDKGQFSTSSIVATLSTDIEDENFDEKSKHVENKSKGNYEELKSTHNDSVCLPSMDTKNKAMDKKLMNPSVDQKSKETVIHKRTNDGGVDKKSKDIANDEKSEDFVNDKKSSDVVIDEKSDDFLNDKKPNDVAIDEKSTDTAEGKKMKEGALDKKSKDVAIDKKSKDSTIDKPSKKVVGKKLKDAPIDKKSKDVTINKKSNDFMADKKIKNVSDKKLEDVVDKKSEDTIVKKSENLSVGKKSKNVPIVKKSKDKIVDEKSEDPIVDKKLGNAIADKKSEDTTVDKKSEDKIVDKKSEDTIDDKKSEDAIIDKKSEDSIVDKKLEDAIVDKKLEDAIVDKKLEDDMIIGSKLANISVDKKSDDVPLDKKSKNAAILENPEIKFQPPLPPSPQIAFLPPLPPSPLPPPPPPEKEKLPIPEIPAVHGITPIEPDNEKPQTKKAIAKKMKKRPRIPCIPIVSRYSRQRHVMVLADYVASKTMIMSDSIRNTVVIENDKEEPKISQTPEVEQKFPPKLTNAKNSSNLTKIQPDNTKNKPVSDTEKKTVAENLVNANDTDGKNSKKLSRIVSENSNLLLNANQPEVDSSTNILTSVGDKKSEDDLKAVSATSEQNIVTENMPKQPESMEESKPEVEAKRVSQKLKKSEKIDTTNKSTSSERETRLALKILASAAPTSEGGTSNRKRNLPREKENQSKPAKQPKVMIVAKRRKPVQLHDSSISSTLVSSAHDRKSEETTAKIIPVKIEVRGRKLRSADK